MNIRLLTFQKRSIIEKALQLGVATADFNSSHRVKEIHDEFIKDTDDDESRPLYCYAYLYNYGVPNIDYIARNWSHLMGFMKFATVASAFVELEVPVSEVLCFTKHNNYKELMDYSSVSKALYGTLKMGDDIEALIPCIKKEWIVSYTPYQNNGYSAQVLSPIIISPDKYPMYLKSVGVSGDGYYRNPENLSEDMGYNNFECKGFSCDTRNLYLTATSCLLNTSSTRILSEYIFGENKIMDGNSLAGRTIDSLLEQKVNLGRYLCEEDLAPVKTSIFKQL